MNKVVFLLLFCLGGASWAQVLNEKSDLRFLALGDSYTIGQNVPVAERWPNQLRDSLEFHYDLQFEDVDIIATTGWRTDNLQFGIAQAQPDSSYDLVSLLIGVNNFFQGRNESQYIREFEELLNQAVAHAQGDKNQVMVVSIPDYAFTPYGRGNASISAGIDRHNFINDSITNLYDIAYYNITPISREGLEDPSLVANDGLHPSGKQYAEWVELIWPQIVVDPISSLEHAHMEYDPFVFTQDQIRSKEGLNMNLLSPTGVVILQGQREINLTGQPTGVYLVTDERGRQRKFFYQP